MPVTKQKVTHRRMPQRVMNRRDVRLHGVPGSVAHGAVPALRTVGVLPGGDDVAGPVAVGKVTR
jgi:hypothetical protein